MSAKPSTSRPPRRATARLAAAIAATALAALAVGGSPAFANDPRHTAGRGTSTNWSGYDVTGSGATHVIATWTAPAVFCGPGESSWSSPWVGLDGDTSGTVEQIGTDSDCRRGVPTYYAWYEMYPKNAVVVGMTVTPGHSYTGEVTASGSSAFVLKLTDNTANTTFTTTQSSRKAHGASAEWIMEGPSSGLLSNFGTVAFSGASATIDGQSGYAASFAGLDPITMVTNQGVIRAQPSSMGAKGSFSVVWKHS